MSNDALEEQSFCFPMSVVYFSLQDQLFSYCMPPPPLSVDVINCFIYCFIYVNLPGYHIICTPPKRLSFDYLDVQYLLIRAIYLERGCGLGLGLRWRLSLGHIVTVREMKGNWSELQDDKVLPLIELHSIEVYYMLINITSIMPLGLDLWFLKFLKIWVCEESSFIFKSV